MGSGTTQAVAMKLGRRFIGADINLGAIQTTTKRLINVADAGSVLMKQNVLEHPPVTYSDEPSPLLMVAEDPVPYGK